MNSLTDTLLALREWRDARAACSHTWCNLSAPDQELTAAQDRLVAAEAKLVALVDALPAVTNSDRIVFWPPSWAPPMFALVGEAYRLVGPLEALER